jgi:integrase
MAFDTGARPQEIKALEAKFFDAEKGRFVVPTTMAKGRRKPRAIYLGTERSLAIVKRLIKEHPLGLLFLSARGTPWANSTICLRFTRLERKLGKRVRLYDMRHSWITNGLRAGVDSHIVAGLAGHSDTSMIDSVYSHVADDSAFMLAAAKKASHAG